MKRPGIQHCDVTKLSLRQMPSHSSNSLFSGMEVYLNDHLITFEVTQKGLISFELPKGTHDIQNSI
jgi:hypothetical protein